MINKCAIIMIGNYPYHTSLHNLLVTIRNFVLFIVLMCAIEFFCYIYYVCSLCSIHNVLSNILHTVLLL